MYLGSFTLSLYALPHHKAKWVQLNGKTLQVLKNSLVVSVFMNQSSLLLYFYIASGTVIAISSFANTSILGQFEMSKCWIYPLLMIIIKLLGTFHKKRSSGVICPFLQGSLVYSEVSNKHGVFLILFKKILPTTYLSTLGWL